MRSPRTPALALSLTACLLGCTPTLPDGYVVPPDPLALPDCEAAESGLEFFMPRKIADFEFQNTATVRGASVNYFSAQYWYYYIDGSSALRFQDAPDGLTSAYQPAATAGARCASDPMNLAGNHVLHVTGGPFLGWGGGMGVAMAHFNQDARLCTQTPRNMDYCPEERARNPLSNSTLNMSQWEGVTFWARRGENSQALLRVLVGDKFTDDDISYLADLADPDRAQPRFCERTRVCNCTYQHLSCDFYPDGTPLVPPGGGYFCGAPGEAPGPAVMAPNPRGNFATNTCNTTRCDEPYAAYPDNGPDPKFAGRPCTTYFTRSGGQTSECYDPASDPPPPDSDQLCGDFWTYPVHLSTDWRFYKVPFNIMYQQGWAKRAPYFDTTSISVFRFTFDTGNVDYYIDDVRFYRQKRK